MTKRGFDPPRIVVGSEKENPVRLSRQDWRGPNAGWAPDSIGHWEVKIERDGRYRVTFYTPGEFDTYLFRSNRLEYLNAAERGKDKATFEVNLSAGDDRIEAYATFNNKVRGAHYVVLEYLGPAKK